MRISNIDVSNLDRVMTLFEESFKNDEYFSNLYPEEAERLSVFRTEYKEDIEAILELNMSLGLFEEDRLIGYILLFDYNDLLYYNNILYNKLFNNINYRNIIHDKITKNDLDAVYILSIVIDENYRRNGYASRLLDYTMGKYYSWSIASDVSNMESLSMYEKRDFKISEIDENYKFVNFS